MLFREMPELRDIFHDLKERKLTLLISYTNNHVPNFENLFQYPIPDVADRAGRV
jgi:hypothetical protein